MTPRHSYYRYWAKSPSGDQPAHLVPYHNLDVAACGRALLRAHPRVTQRLADALGLDPDETVALLTFLLSLHDVGKFTDAFQHLQPGLADLLGGPSSVIGHAPQYGNPDYHGGLGALLWHGVVFPTWFEEGGGGLADSAPSRRRARSAVGPLVDAVMGHHGRPVPTPENRDRNGVPYACDEALADVVAYAAEVADLLLPDDLDLTWSDDLAGRAKAASWTVAGLAVLADWIGSDGAAFPRTTEPVPLADYWEKAEQYADEAVRRAGVFPTEPAPDEGTRALFGYDRPTPLQRYAETVPVRREDGPYLFVLEDLTGAGKTEAAVVLAHRLMRAGLASGLYVGLPTMATADQMFGRLERAVDRLFADPAAASVTLAHSARDLSERYREITLPADPAAADDRPEEDAPAAAQCAEWIAASRKRALLADLGVGTVDQALLGALPAAHQSLRLFGLGRHVLVVDEVHAYDAYMLRLLRALLAFQAAAGGSAILLSATLPHGTRQLLADEFQRGFGADPVALRRTGDDDYPLATSVSTGGVGETPIDRRPGATRTVRVRRFTDEREVASEVVDAAQRGDAVVWIRNTVHDAVRGLDLVRRRLGSHPGELVDLLHARFALGHRLAKEKRVLAALGPEGGPDDRRGRVVVATQVVEQSLDLDADLLVSDLAPVDLLLQRAGRLHRHVRDGDGRRVPGAEGRDHRNDGRGAATLGVLAPSDAEPPSADWYERLFPKAAYVYPDHGRLWLTARELPDGQAVTVPDDARALIRAVYGPDARDRVPGELLPRTYHAEGEGRKDAAHGEANALDRRQGYTTGDATWTRDDAQQTRLGERSVRVRLVDVTDPLDPRPLVDEGPDPWALSELPLRESLAGRLPVGEAHRDALDRAVATMPDEGRHVRLVPLISSGDKWTLTGPSASGSARTLQYSLDKGLELL